MTFLEENPVLYYKIIWMSGCAAEWSVDIGQCCLWALMANRKRGTTEYGSVYKLARVYDTFMDNIPYEEWCEYLTGLMREYGVRDGLVLDLGVRYREHDRIACKGRI